jgi:hypothetical protein
MYTIGDLKKKLSYLDWFLLASQIGELFLQSFTVSLTSGKAEFWPKRISN